MMLLAWVVIKCDKNGHKDYSNKRENKVGKRKKRVKKVYLFFISNPANENFCLLKLFFY